MKHLLLILVMTLSCFSEKHEYVIKFKLDYEIINYNKTPIPEHSQNWVITDSSGYISFSIYRLRDKDIHTGIYGQNFYFREIDDVSYEHLKWIDYSEYPYLTSIGYDHYSIVGATYDDSTSIEFRIFQQNRDTMECMEAAMSFQMEKYIGSTDDYHDSIYVGSKFTFNQSFFGVIDTRHLPNETRYCQDPIKRNYSSARGTATITRVTKYDFVYEDSLVADSIKSYEDSVARVIFIADSIRVADSLHVVDSLQAIEEARIVDSLRIVDSVHVADSLKAYIDSVAVVDSLALPVIRKSRVELISFRSSYDILGRAVNRSAWIKKVRR